MTYPLHAPPVLVVHNEPGRTVYVVHAGDEDGTPVTVLQPDVGTCEVVTLPHDVARFTHEGVITALHGLYGATVMSGTTPMFQTTAAGPHRFVGGRFLPPTGVPDFRGLLIDEQGKLGGRLELHGGMGDLVAACTYRNVPVGFFQGPVFSALGTVTSPPPPGQHPRTLGEIYIHPHIKMINVAVRGGWIYSVDDTRAWHLLPQDGWPVKFGDTDIWLATDTEFRPR